MIISHKHKLCFVHIPKNAGTSVRKMLLPYHEGPMLYGLKTIQSKLTDLSHINIDELCIISNDNRYKEDYYNFCIIRDPLQRFKSAYVEYSHHVKHHFNETPKSVPELLTVIENTNKLINDVRYVHFRPQTFYTHDANNIKVLHTFNIDDIHKCIEFVCNRVGTKPFCNTKENAGKSNKFDDIASLTCTDTSRIQKIYEKDYRLLFSTETMSTPS